MKRYLCVVVFLVAVGLCSDLRAQATGRVVGSILDQTNSAVPGARIDLFLPLGERAIYNAVTNEIGLFTIAGVPPGSYVLVVSKPGFQKSEKNSVTVSLGGDTGIAPIHLQVETVASQVDIVASELAVQTSSADLSTTISKVQLEKLPILDRAPLGLIQTQAGVSDGRGPTVINGLRVSYAAVTLDGINIQDNILRSNGLDFVPNRLLAGQVTEISITTANADATANGGAAHVRLVTPSGGNEYHGAFYWYNRNSLFAANEWLNNRDRIARPFLNQNQLGGTIGGPVIRDKLLFFGNYELFRYRQKVSTNRTILTSDARSGLFTYRDSSGVLRKINVLQAAGVSADPAAQSLLAAVPTPEGINNFRVGDSTDTLLRNTAGYSFPQRNNKTRDNVTFKLDFLPSTNHTLSGTYLWNREIADRPELTTGFTEIPKIYGDDHTQLLSLGWRWSPSGGFTNEVRGGFNLAPSTLVSTEDVGAYIIVPTLIANPVNAFKSQGRATNTFSYMDNASYTRGRHMVQFGFQAQHIRTSPYNDVGTTPTYFLGISNNPGLAQLPGTEQAAANNLLALLAGYLSSSSQTFNITDRDSGFVNGATNLRHFRFSQYGFYLQDRWKTTSNLTASLGLRYDYFGVIDERDGLSLLPVLVDNDPIKTLLSNSALDFSGSAVGRPFYNKDLNNFAPNVGLAYDPFGRGKTVLRGGYSISYVNDEHIFAMRSTLNMNGGLSLESKPVNLSGRISSGLPAIPVPTYKVSRTFADNFQLDGLTSFALPDPNLRTPYVQEWHFGIQHNLKGAIIEARYVGNRTTKAFRAYDYNQVVIRENGFLDDFLRARNNGNLARAATGAFNPVYDPAIPGSQPLTVFPLLAGGGGLGITSNRNMIDKGEVGELAASYQKNRTNGQVQFYRNPVAAGASVLTSSSNANYNALQIDVRQRVADLQFQANYTFSKALSDMTGTMENRFEPLLDNSNPALEKSRPPFDITHAFKANAIYDLPAGPGHRFNVQRLGRLLSGWTASGILVWQSGVPFSILSALNTVNRAGRSGSNTANSSLSLDQLDEVVGFRMTNAGPYMIAASAINTDDGRGVALEGRPEFNGQVFFNPTPGNSGMLPRRAFNGPSTYALDVALLKKTQLTDYQSLEFRMQASNVLNHPTWNVGDQTIGLTNFGKIQGVFNERRVIQFSLHYRF